MQEYNALYNYRNTINDNYSDKNNYLFFAINYEFILYS